MKVFVVIHGADCIVASCIEDPIIQTYNELMANLVKQFGLEEVQEMVRNEVLYTGTAEITNIKVTGETSDEVDSDTRKDERHPDGDERRENLDSS